MKKLLVTGANGLIGSEVVSYFCENGWKVFGLDNNMRADFFGPQGDTRWNQKRLEEKYNNFEHKEVDIRDRDLVFKVVEDIKPDAIAHTAAQPSHDLAASRPLDDFDVNAVGTINMLEAVRKYVPDSPFAHMSTNKVYGDAPNEIPLIELETRWDYVDAKYYDGIKEDFRIDQSKHSIFGASKVAGDVMVQEYGRYFGMQTCCLRGGCLTGPNHSGVELHGFLSYLVKVNVTGGTYKVFGYKGKQVRDNIHSYDVTRFIDEFFKNPRSGEVYNLGGGRDNSCSILEAFSITEAITGKKMNYEYVEKNREGDHICYISDLSKMKEHYPEWDITISLQEIFEQIVKAWESDQRS
ncbi:MAG: NAD-dependent epimerase/dehydratase family protein [Ignavibacteriae bacterium]|nr:NAD-dependent epimerase/dehydratase family protein [Ignavibacteriota bacterium]MCB9244047.1 NAD-dependent epimerase/dehydratase family protein [Ignavibacteriales bacterium]